MDEERNKKTTRDVTKNKDISTEGTQNFIELVRLQLAKKIENSNELADVILRLNKPEKSLALTKRKFLKVIKQMIKHMDPKKITATEEELLDDVWEQACGSDLPRGKNEVIEKIMFDKWLFSNTFEGT